ncbi:hypothetical protein HYN59_04650 [Flavobacterium album]|uniref:Glycosyltransferase 2-like domain-containing protein n=1 Tax=Flavobacterium album TaxID=2175091 RepID=A0A2S1QVT0_9FLAO|nr:glycosyltransferase family 2 protein [Flavobacterium album]AWH84449.1 hypothetical protein HYN59_04650 [Flavobacterium album]
MNIQLSVIIVNYNGLKYLRDCFDSLIDKLGGLTYEIIVLDNDSRDESCSFIEENYPDVILIRSTENLGFGRGNNEAVRHARGEYLLLLNNDTILLDSLMPVYTMVSADPSIGAIGIMMLDGNREYLQSAGKFPDVSGMFRIKNLSNMGKEFETGVFSRTAYEVDWLGGAFLMMPKKIYEEINGFDQNYFLYVEDVDLCKMIADKGYKRIFVPGYRYIHFVGFNTSKNPFLIKGYKIFINKHHKGFTKLKMLFALKINEVIKAIKAKLKK